MWCCCSSTPSLIFFTTDTPTTQIYTLSLHDALPISEVALQLGVFDPRMEHRCQQAGERPGDEDRKSTRLNSSHLGISYAVFCLKKKNKRTYRNAYCSIHYTRA